MVKRWGAEGRGGKKPHYFPPSPTNQRKGHIQPCFFSNLKPCIKICLTASAWEPTIFFLRNCTAYEVGFVLGVTLVIFLVSQSPGF